MDYSGSTALVFPLSPSNLSQFLPLGAVAALSGMNE